jgi:chemotaxis protein MotB
VTGEGLRIELLETEKGMFFETGKPEPTTTGKDLLIKLSQELGAMPNSILIEGHTDSKQYQGAKYSNWELSADRANSARKIMEDNGLRPDQVTQVRGFANQQLRVPDKPDDPSNRRVSIIVQYPQNAEPEALAKEGKAGEEGAAPEQDKEAEAGKSEAPAKAAEGHGAASRPVTKPEGKK